MGVRVPDMHDWAKRSLAHFLWSQILSVGSDSSRYVGELSAFGKSLKSALFYAVKILIVVHGCLNNESTSIMSLLPFGCGEAEAHAATYKGMYRKTARFEVCSIGNSKTNRSS